MAATITRRLDGYDYINISLLAAVVIISATIIWKLVAIVDADKAIRAEEASRKIVAQDALTANNDLSEEMTGALVQRCERTAGYSAAGLSICSGFLSTAKYYQSARNFLAAYNDAVSLRLGSSNFSLTEKAYRKALDDPGLAQSETEWRSRVWEGIAYSQFKSGDLKEARKSAAQAVALDPYSEFAGATSLKIACTSLESASSVKTEYFRLFKQLMQHLSEMKTRKANLGIRNARLEVEYLQRDAELYHLCAYADLSSESVR